MAGPYEPAELFDIDMDELAGFLALVAANGLGGLQIAIRLNPKRRRMRWAVAGDTPTSAAICLPVWRCRRNVSTVARVATGVWLGDEWGRDERSRNPSTPSARNRLTHLATFFGVVAIVVAAHR
jgi:hypothetical protein